MTSSYLEEFQPPQRILLGPGPSNVHPRVLKAMTLPVLGHLDPQFFQVMDEVCEMLREVFNTSNFMTLPLSSTGTGAMEAACANVLDGKTTSIYWWEGAVAEEGEVSMLLKTREDLVNQVVEQVKEMHSYDCPCVVSIPITGGNAEFLDWIDGETAEKS